MSQESSLTQSGHSVRQALTTYNNGYVSREPNDIRDDDKGYARLISEWSASIGLNANLQCSLTSTDQSYPNLTAHRQGSRFASRFDMIVP